MDGADRENIIIKISTVDKCTAISLVLYEIPPINRYINRSDSICVLFEGFEGY